MRRGDSGDSIFFPSALTARSILHVMRGFLPWLPHIHISSSRFKCDVQGHSGQCSTSKMYHQWAGMKEGQVWVKKGQPTNLALLLVTKCTGVNDKTNAGPRPGVFFLTEWGLCWLENDIFGGSWAQDTSWRLLIDLINRAMARASQGSRSISWLLIGATRWTLEEASWTSASSAQWAGWAANFCQQLWLRFQFHFFMN